MLIPNAEGYTEPRGSSKATYLSGGPASPCTRRHGEQVVNAKYLASSGPYVKGNDPDQVLLLLEALRAEKLPNGCGIFGSDHFRTSAAEETQVDRLSTGSSSPRRNITPLPE